MREFIYYSANAVTSGNMIKDDLMKAGRIDIACQIVIQSFFVSHHMRENVKLHLIFDGAPDAPKHLEIFPGQNLEGVEGRIDISKKDVAGLFKKMLYKYRKGEKTQIAPGYFIEKKSFSDLVLQLSEEGKEVYMLDKKGTDTRKENFSTNSVFVIGDQDGIPKRELKRIKSKGIEIKKISVGPYMLFASQTMTILQNELDRREVEYNQEN
jgi:tRNA (pseudouridine54-N1)-methyltransferase